MHPNATYYDMLAKVYDSATERPEAWVPPHFLHSIIVGRSLAAGKILDIGIGTGKSIDVLYKSGHRNIFGIDCSAEMLHECRLKYPEIDLILGRFEDIDLSNECPFDLIISSGVFEFIQEFPEALAKCAALLPKNGALLFTYEPLLDDHVLQRSRKSLVVPSPTSRLYVEDFYTYRHKQKDVLDILDRQGLAVELDEAFEAYKKLNNVITYRCILARKK
jgi:predicted TPR repeat methyltransferase